MEERYTLGPLTHQTFEVTNWNLHPRSVPDPVLNARDMELNNTCSVASESWLPNGGGRLVFRCQDALIPPLTGVQKGCERDCMV